MTLSQGIAEASAFSVARVTRDSSVLAAAPMLDRCKTPSTHAAVVALLAGHDLGCHANRPPRPDSEPKWNASTSPSPLVKDTNSFSPAIHKRRESRRLAYRLRDTAACLMPSERVGFCGRRAKLGHVDVRCGERASYGGLYSCGSVWHCPVCASKIAEGRRQELRALADAHGRAGAVAYMAAFTLRHKRWQSAAMLRKAVAGSWSKLIAGAPWKRASAAAACVGWVRALEVTYGRNGWHPHIHAVFFLESEASAAKFGEWLFGRWSRTVETLGFGRCTRKIWRFERAAHYDAVSDYVVKGNFDMEITRGHMKLARHGARSPWQLLEDAATSSEARKLFLDFAHAFKGARQVTYSLGIRDRYALTPETSDDALAAVEDAAPVIGTIPAYEFRLAMQRGLGPAILDAAEEGGWPAVVSLLERLRVWKCHGNPSCKPASWAEFRKCCL